MSGDPWDAVSVPAGNAATATAAPAPSSSPWDAVSVPASAGKVPIQAQAPAQDAVSGVPIPSQGQPGAGIGANIKAGAVEGVTGTVGSIVDALNPVNAARRVIHSVGDAASVGAKLASGQWTPEQAAQMRKADAAFEDSLNATPHKLDQVVGAATGYNPENVKASTFGERLARGVTAGVTGGAILPVGEEGPIINGIRSALVGAGAGTGSTVASEVAPDDLKPAAGFVGGIVGGGAVGAAEAAARGLAPAADSALASVSTGAAERAAARILATNATDPAAAAAALEQPGEIVPGSQPTTFQQTGDPGLGALEREVMTRDQPAFQQRRADQNTARVQALGDIQKGADPNDVAATLRRHFNDIDASHEAAVDAAAKAAQDKAAQFGGTLPPDQYGQIIRDAMETGERGAAAHVSSFYKAIDPNGDLTGNLSATREGAQQIVDKIGPTAQPMSAEEADVFDKATGLPDLAPAQHLIDLRQYLNAVTRQELSANGKTPTYARLTQLRNVIDDNLANSISQHIANEVAMVEQGQLQPSQTMAARVQSQVDAWRAQRNAALEGGSGQAPANTAGATATISGVPGADSAAGEVAGAGAGGNQGSARTPSFDEAARQRLIAANQAAREKAQVWGPKAIESVLAKDGNGNFRMSDGKVAAAFFHPGPSAFEHMQQALKASPESLPALVDYAATTLRRAHMNQDGTLDPAGFERWHKAYADALRALPDDAKAKFADAASATQALADARAARTAALKAAQEGAIGRVMHLTEPQDVTRTVGSILNGRTAVADMKALALATKSNPEARAGLRQAVADYMSNKLIGNTEAGTSGVAQIKGDAYQTFIKNARSALHLIFAPEEVRTMEAIAEDIQRSNRTINSKPPGTPGTAHDVMAGLKKAAGHGSKSMLDIIGGVIGHHLGGEAGLAAGIGAAELIKGLQSKGIARIDGLVSEAMLNPDLARELLKKAPPKPSFRPVTVALLKAVPATSAATATQR